MYDPTLPRSRVFLPAIFSGILLYASFFPLNLGFLGEVEAKSKTNDLLKDAHPGPVAELDKLPAGLMLYSAMQIRPAILKEFGAMIFGALAGDKKDDPSAKAIKEAMDVLAAAKPKLMAQGASMPGKSLSVTVVEVDWKLARAWLRGRLQGD